MAAGQAPRVGTEVLEADRAGRAFSRVSLAAPVTPRVLGRLIAEKILMSYSDTDFADFGSPRILKAREDQKSVFRLLGELERAAPTNQQSRPCYRD